MTFLFVAMEINAAKECRFNKEMIRRGPVDVDVV